MITRQPRFRIPWRSGAKRVAPWLVGGIALGAFVATIIAYWDRLGPLGAFVILDLGFVAAFSIWVGTVALVEYGTRGWVQLLGLILVVPAVVGIMSYGIIVWVLDPGRTTADEHNQRFFNVDELSEPIHVATVEVNRSPRPADALRAPLPRTYSPFDPGPRKTATRDGVQPGPVGIPIDAYSISRRQALVRLDITCFIRAVVIGPDKNGTVTVLVAAQPGDKTLPPPTGVAPCHGGLTHYVVVPLRVSPSTTSIRDATKGTARDMDASP